MLACMRFAQHARCRSSALLAEAALVNALGGPGAWGLSWIETGQSVASALPPVQDFLHRQMD
jgi:hypothetical protein